MKKLIFAACAFLLGLSAFCQTSVKDIVSKEYADELLKNGTVSIVHDKKDNVITMVPECEYAEKIKSNLISATVKGVPFLAEFLYLIPKSELLPENSDKTITTDEISVLFRSVSKMEGMKYVHNRGKVDVLYKKAYMISGLNSDTPVADPIEGSADGLVAYCYQHDHTFGDTKYKLNYRQSGNTLYATFLNTVPMSKLGFKAVMPENLRMSVLSIDLGDSLLLYLAADVSARSAPGVRDQIEDSMTVRMDAIYKWFMLQFK